MIEEFRNNGYSLEYVEDSLNKNRLNPLLKNCT